MAAEFDISKHSTSHDIHDDCVWIEHGNSNMRIERMTGSKKIDDCCEIQYNGDANMTRVRQKHRECMRNSRIIDLAILKKSSHEAL
jgi:hypothetical protein